MANFFDQFDSELPTSPKFSMQSGESQTIPDDPNIVGEVTLGGVSEATAPALEGTNFFDQFDEQPSIPKGANFFDQFDEQAPVAASVTPSEPPAPAAPRDTTMGKQFGRGLRTTFETAKFIPEIVGLQDAAKTSGTARNELAVFDMIDEGKPITSELLAGLGVSSLFVNMYKDASPEERQKLRGMQAQKISKARERTLELLPELSELDKRRQESAPRVGELTSIRSFDDFKDWLAFTGGSVLPQIGLTMAGAAVAGIPGAVGTSLLFNFPAQVELRFGFIMKVVKDLPPEEQAKAVMEYLDKTSDVTMAVSLAQGGLDAFGPVGAVLRRKLASKEGVELITRYQTKQEAAKAAVKEIPRQVGEETVTEGGQASLDITGERVLDEQGDLALFSKKNIFRVINAAAAGTVGGGTGAGVNVATSPIQPALQQRAVKKAQAEIQRQIQQSFVKENADRIGKTFDSLVATYKLDGLTDAEAMVKAGEDIRSGAVDPLAPTDVDVDVDVDADTDTTIPTLTELAPTDVVTTDTAAPIPTLTDLVPTDTTVTDTAADTTIPTLTDTATETTTDTALLAPPVAPIELAPEDQARLESAQREVDEAQDSLNYLASQGFTLPQEHYGVEANQAKLAKAQAVINELQPPPAAVETVTPTVTDTTTDPNKRYAFTPEEQAQYDVIAPQEEKAFAQLETARQALFDGAPVIASLGESELRRKLKYALEDVAAGKKPSGVEAMLLNVRPLVENFLSAQDRADALYAQLNPLLTVLLDGVPKETTGETLGTTTSQAQQTKTQGQTAPDAGTTVIETTPTDTVPLEQVTSDTPSTQLPTNPATGLKPPGKRRGGRKPVERTAEQTQAAAEQRKDRQKVGRSAIRTAERAQKVIETPFDPDSYDTVDMAKQSAMELEQLRRDALVDAFRVLADKNVAPNTKAKRVAQEVINHPSVDVRERTIAENLSKRPDTVARSDLIGDLGVLGGLTSQAVDPAFRGFTTATQAIDHIIKTGNAFEKLLARRIKPFLNGVRLVTVLNPATDITDPVARDEFTGATGLYAEGDDGSRTIYLNDFPDLEGTNNLTVLHEAVHGATMSQVNSWIRDPNSVSPQAAKALNDMKNIMLDASNAYATFNAVGLVDPLVQQLYNLDAFTDLKEFVAYGLTQPEMQDFLSKIKGKIDLDKDSSRGLLSRFVRNIRSMFEMGPQYNTAFTDLLVVTDQLLSAPVAPISQAEATAAAKRITSQERVVDKIANSRPEEIARDTGNMSVISRNANDAVRFLNSAFDAMSVNSVRAALFTLSSRDVVRWAGNRIINLKFIGKTVDQMSGMRAQLIRELSQTVDPWLKFNRQQKKGGRILADLMNATTLTGVDPTQFNTVQAALAGDAELTALRAELRATANAPTADSRAPRQIRGDITRREGDIRLIYEGGQSPSGYAMKGWNELGTIANGEGHRIYKTVKDTYAKTLQRHQDLLLSKIKNSDIPGTESDEATPKGKLIAEITRSFQEAKKIGVYFPLRRFGDKSLRVGKGRTSKFYMFESAVDRNEFARRLVEQQQREGDPRSYEAVLADGDMAISDDMSRLRSDITDSSSMLKGIFNLLEGSAITDPSTGRVMLSDVDVIKDQVYQMYLMTLPEQDMRKRFTHRKGRTGFTADALRTFITTQHTAANQLSRLAYADQIRNAVGSSYAELQGNPDALKLSAFVDELAKRAASEMQPESNEDGFGNAIARLGNQGTFFYMLSSIKSAIVQTTQLPVVGIPVLASRYGLSATTAALAPYSMLWNRFGLTKYNDQGELVTEWGKPSINDSNYVNKHPDPEYREALRAAWLDADRKNLFMATYASDMTARGRAPTKSQESAIAMARKAAANFLSGAFHHSERITREMVYMSAFELEMAKLAKQGVPIAEATPRAIETAADLVHESVFDYTQFNKPRAMTYNWLTKLGTQFLTFPLQMTSYLVRNFYGMLPMLNKEGKKAAATQLFGTLMMTWAFAGTVGMPLYSVVVGVLEGLRDSLRPDEDDPEADQYYDMDDEGNPLGKRNLDLWFRETFIPSYFGRGSALANAMGLTDEQANVMQRAIKMGPVSALTDLNIGSSTTLNNMWFQDTPPSDSYQSAFRDMLYNLPFGPTGSMLETAAGSLDDFSKGDWSRGVEKLLPAGFRGVAKAVRLSSEGERTLQGAIVKDEEWFTVGKLLAQAGGFQSTEIAEIQKKNFIVKQLVTGIEKEKQSVLDGIDKAVQRYENNPTDKNFDAFTKAIDEAYAYNYRNGFGTFAITQDTLKRSIKGRAERRAGAIDGLVVSPKQLPFVLPLIERTR